MTSTVVVCRGPSAALWDVTPATLDAVIAQLSGCCMKLTGKGCCGLFGNESLQIEFAASRQPAAFPVGR